MRTQLPDFGNINQAPSAINMYREYLADELIKYMVENDLISLYLENKITFDVKQKIDKLSVSTVVEFSRNTIGGRF